MIACFTPAKRRIFSFPIVAFCLFAIPAVANDEQTKVENALFKEAVQAVKDRNYKHAITLFEEQAKLPRHDAQYNLAVLLHAGKGRPRNYVEALFWSWQAQLGGIEDAEDLAADIIDLLPPKTADELRTRVGNTLQSRIDAKDILAIPQFANFHLTILAEPDYTNAYIWLSIAVALGLPDTIDARDNAESQLESEDLIVAQIRTQELFEKHNFTPLQSTAKADSGGSK